MSVAPAYTLLVQRLVPGIEVLDGAHIKSPSGLVRRVRSIRRERPDLVLSMSPAARNSMLALLSGARAVAGFLAAGGRDDTHNHPQRAEAFGFAGGSRIDAGSLPIRERAPLLLRLLGLDPARLDRRAPSPAGEKILLFPFAHWEYRAWPGDRYAALAARLREATGRDVAIVGGPDQLPRLQALGDANTIVCPTPDRLVDLLAEAALVVGNDSGPVHLASFLGKPVVGLFGPAPPSLTAPVNPRARFLYQALPCSPCDQIRCVRPGDSCMQRIELRSVVDAVLGLLSVPEESPRA
jgi:ADP-heptose:LPS heptosyltransferase